SELTCRTSFLSTDVIGTQIDRGGETVRVYRPLMRRHMFVEATGFVPGKDEDCVLPGGCLHEPIDQPRHVLCSHLNLASRLRVVFLRMLRRASTKSGIDLRYRWQVATLRIFQEFACSNEVILMTVGEGVHAQLCMRGQCAVVGIRH